MAYVDTQIEFSDSQAVTATAISTNVYDLFSMSTGGSATDLSPNTRIDVGSGEDVYLIVNTAVAVTDASSDATLVVTFETADDITLTTNVQTVFSTGTPLAFAAFSVAGTNLVRIKIPAFAYRRYIGVRYTVAAGPLTAGAFDAYISTGVDANRIYKSGFTVQ